MQFPAIAGWLCLALTGTVAAQRVSSLSDSDIEITETKLTLETVAEANKELQAQLVLAREQIRALTESLAIANSETEVFKRQINEMSLRMEALGIDAAGPGKSKLEQRLLKAVNDLRIIQAEHDKLADQLVRLSEAVFAFVKTAESSDVQARLTLEQEMRLAGESLGLPSTKAVSATAVNASVTDAIVVSIKKELALVVANVGADHGVRIGMPFEVWRAGKSVGSVRVVDVRQKIAGAVIQNLQSEKNPVKVGDRLRVQTNK